MASEYQSLMAGLAKAGISSDQLILPTTLGPVTAQDLPFLEGWRWVLRTVGYPGIQPVLTQGGPLQTILDITDERGWAVNGAVAFSSPYGEATVDVDDWHISGAPYLINIFNPVHRGNTVFFNTQYTPATPLGPIYAFGLDPPYPLPYARKLTITARLPATAPIVACLLVAAEVGRIAIVDNSIFLRSIKKHIIEQMTGVRMERYL